MIAPNIIIIWTGTNGTIPAGFVRETSLDGRYPKGHGNQTPNSLGGSATHSHSSPSHAHVMNSHSHTVSLNAKGNNDNNSDGAGSESFAYDHGHTASLAGVSGGSLQNTAVTYGSVSNDPPYKTVIFIKSTGYQFCPAQACMLWSTTTAPTDFNFCDGTAGRPNYLNVYLKGADSGADAGSTGGSYTNIHNINHSHTENSHSHSGTITGGTCSAGGARGQGGGYNEYVAQGHDHNIYLDSRTTGVNSTTINLTTTETVEPAYKKLGLIQNTSNHSSLKRGSIAMYLGSTTNIPAGWTLCDGNNGTPDLRNYFIKVAENTSTINNTGGSNTHTHAAQAHGHTGGSHTHANSNSSDWGHSPTDRNQHGNGSGRGINRGDIAHDVLTVSSDTVSWANSNTTADSSDNQPLYRTVAYIQFGFSAMGSGLFFNTLL